MKKNENLHLQLETDDVSDRPNEVKGSEVSIGSNTHRTVNDKIVRRKQRVSNLISLGEMMTEQGQKGMIKNKVT